MVISFTNPTNWALQFPTLKRLKVRVPLYTSGWIYFKRILVAHRFLYAKDVNLLGWTLYDTMSVKFTTKYEKYTFWDVFFISLANMTILFDFTKKNKSFPYLKDIMPYLGQGEGCALHWALTSLRLGRVWAFHSLPTTYLHISLYIWSWKLAFHCICS